MADEPSPEQSDRVHGYSIAGVIILMIGIALYFIAFFMDTSLPNTPSSAMSGLPYASDAYQHELKTAVAAAKNQALLFTLSNWGIYGGFFLAMTGSVIRAIRRKTD